MHPAFVEAFRLLQWGSASNWWGLSCPAHCTSSPLFVVSLLCSGFCLGSLFTVLFGLWFFLHRPSHLLPQKLPSYAYRHICMSDAVALLVSAVKAAANTLRLLADSLDSAADRAAAAAVAVLSEVDLRDWSLTSSTILLQPRPQGPHLLSPLPRFQEETLATTLHLTRWLAPFLLYQLIALISAIALVARRRRSRRGLRELGKLDIGPRQFWRARSTDRGQRRRSRKSHPVTSSSGRLGSPLRSVWILLLRKHSPSL